MNTPKRCTIFTLQPHALMSPQSSTPPEEQAYKDLQYLISVLLVQPNFLLFLSLLPSILQPNHMNCIPSTMS